MKAAIYARYRHVGPAVAFVALWDASVLTADAADDIRDPLGNFLGSFGVYVTKDGKQGFRFVAMNKQLPSAYKNMDPDKLYETLISNELGKRQYCMKGWEIVSKTPVKKYIIYEGVCK
jgi:hypothetical protein